MQTSSWKRIAIGAIGVATALAVFAAVRARAAGIPDANVLTYTGYLEDADGNPLSGEHSISVRFWESSDAPDDLCTGSLDTVELQAGRFQVPLPDSCTDAVKASPDIYVDVAVDGASLGRTKLGAVPFAVEAGHATLADTATNAEQATGDLDGRIAGIETDLGDLAPKTDLPVLSAWAQYTPVLSANGGVAIANSTSVGSYRRVGDSLEVMIVTTFSAFPNSGATWYQWSIPAGLEIDWARMPGGAGSGICGSGMYGKGIGNNIALAIYVRNPTTVSATANGAGIYYVNDTVPAAITNESSFNFEFTVPIEGWTTTD